MDMNFECSEDRSGFAVGGLFVVLLSTPGVLLATCKSRAR